MNNLTQLSPPRQAILNPLDIEPVDFSQALQRREENRNTLINWIKGNLVPSVDFGTIVVKNRESRPFLMKPGAEKICGMLGLTVNFPNLEQYEQVAINSQEIKMIILRCELRTSNGQIVAEGTGSRVRTQDIVKLRDGTEYHDINKAIKMAEKSAHIDAVLRCAGLSEMFTQDIEDMPHINDQQPPNQSEQPRKISDAQKRRLEALINDYKLDRKRVKSYCTRCWNVQHFKDLTREQYKILDSKLPKFAEQSRQEERNTQGEATTEEDRKIKAEELKAKAKQIRQAAQYADGQAYYDDINQAQQLEAKAAQLLTA